MASTNLVGSRTEFMMKTMHERETLVILDELKVILTRSLDLNLEPGEITAEVPLLEGGLALDSVVIAELITHIERRWGFQFDDRSLRADLFENLMRLAEFVAAERRNAGVA